jgi:biotin operon repressor
MAIDGRNARKKVLELLTPVGNSYPTMTEANILWNLDCSDAKGMKAVRKALSNLKNEGVLITQHMRAREYYRLAPITEKQEIEVDSE